MLKLNKKEILEYQMNVDEYLFVDEATEIIPGKSAKGYKYLDENEWYFKLHWPGDPNMPGVLQIECLTQMCSLALVTIKDLKKKIVYLNKIINASFLKKITPNQKMIIETEILNFSRGVAKCTGVGIINGIVVLKSDFILILPDVLKNYSIKN